MPTATTTILRKTIADMYEPYRAHPELFTDTFEEKWLHPDFLEIYKAFQKANEKADPEQISSKLKVEMPQVYSFNVFSSEFIRIFDEEVANFYHKSEEKNIPIHRPNSMNKYGVVLNEIGMRPLITSFQQKYLWPVAKRLFPIHASQFDDHHSFIVRYQAGEDLGLDMHTDDSDVTFNVCLGENFTGSTLSFCGMFGASNHRKFTHVYHHEIGRAILHLGSRRHGADDIDTGRRANLIVWNHNWKYRGSEDRNVGYHREEGPPDLVCLSYTHDIDYVAYKDIPKHVELEPESHMPWCPPMGTEYDEFEENMIKTSKRQKLEGRKAGEL